MVYTSVERRLELRLDALGRVLGDAGLRRFDQRTSLHHHIGARLAVHPPALARYYIWTMILYIDHDIIYRLAVHPPASEIRAGVAATVRHICPRLPRRVLRI